MRPLRPASGLHLALAVVTMLSTAGHLQAQTTRPADAAQAAPAGTTTAPALRNDPGQMFCDHADLIAATAPQFVPNYTDWILIWLQAAARLSPGLAEAHFGQYELLTSLNRPEEAAAALAAYCRLQPDDLAAALGLIADRVQACQTVEARLAACQAFLQEAPWPAEVASDLHRRLAELYRGQGDAARTGEHVRRAVGLCPANLVARTLQADLDNRLADPLTRLDLLLAELAAAPDSFETALRVAELLADWPLPGPAAAWYETALVIGQRIGPDDPTLDRLRVELARCHLANDDPAAALRAAEQALVKQMAYPAASLAIRAARQVGNTARADELLRGLREGLSAREDQVRAGQDAEGALQLAGFYLELLPDGPRAREFAELARRSAPESPLAKCALGWAHLETGETEAAAALLEPLAESDAWAAVGLARIRLVQGNRPAALATLRQAEKLQAIGSARDRATVLLREMGEAPLPAADARQLLERLNRFDRRLLDYPQDPGKAVDLRVTVAPAKARWGEPLLARVVLTNRGPYPLSLGPRRMLDPQVRVTARQLLHQGRVCADYLNISLARRYQLPPGEQIVVEQRVDVGPAAMLWSWQPQRKMEFEFSFVIDPQPAEEGQPAVPRRGLEPVTVQVLRNPPDASPAGLEVLARRLHDANPAQRLQAVAEVAALIGEREESMQAIADYHAFTVDAGRLSAWLREALRDPDPLVRTQAVWSWRQLPVNDEFLTAAAPLLGDPHWLVRLAAVEVLANRRGPAFLRPLDRLAEDADPLVARLAAFYREQLSRAFSGKSNQP